MLWTVLKVYGCFYFSGKTIREIIKHDTMQLWLMPQLLSDRANVVLQCDRVPPQTHSNVTTVLNRKLPHSWFSQTCPLPKFQHFPIWQLLTLSCWAFWKIRFMFCQCPQLRTIQSTKNSNSMHRTAFTVNCLEQTEISSDAGWQMELILYLYRIIYI